jgi:hypothetical protein
VGEELGAELQAASVITNISPGIKRRKHVLWKCLNKINHRKHQPFELLSVRLHEIFNALAPAATPNNRAIRVKAGLAERN